MYASNNRRPNGIAAGAAPSKKSHAKRWVIAVVIVLLVAAGAYFSWRHFIYKPAPIGPKVYNNSVNYAPATPEEKQQSEDSKDTIVENKNNSTNQPTTPSGKKAVVPSITLAQFSDGSALVQAYVSGIFEDSGTCTAILKSGSQTVTKQAPAFANATTTDCQHIEIPRSQFPASGTWSVNVSYSSPNAEGTSNQTQNITIP